MPVPRGYSYRTMVRWDGQRRGTLSSDGKPELAVATPPEFGGHSGVWTPEDLIVAAINSCVMCAFLYFAKLKGVELVSYTCEAVGELEKGPEGLTFSSFTVRPNVVIAPGADLMLARETVEKAGEQCLISESVKTRVRVEAQVSQACA